MQTLTLGYTLPKSILNKIKFVTQRTPAQLLEESRGFIRCHQSYWVNLSRVRCIRDGAFVMESGGCVPISRTYQHPAREAFFRSLVDGEK